MTNANAQRVPLHVWVGRHIVIVGAAVLLATYWQEGGGWPSIWSYVGQFVLLLTVAAAVAGLVTLFSSRRSARAFNSRLIATLWPIALLLVIGSAVPHFADHRKIELASPGDSAKTTINVKVLRERYPEQTKNMSDMEVARMAYKAIKPAMSFEEFAALLGAQ